ncbi:hypothetical protein LQL77_32165 [Rhodococcus cerastii]|nr:hypothetical protein [Rhodococcus cerastii]
MGAAARSVTEVAAAHSVSWPTAHRAFVAHAGARLTEPLPVRALGIVYDSLIRDRCDGASSNSHRNTVVICAR